MTRPGPRRAGLRLPTPEELRDHRQREKACAAIEQLCRIGGIPVEGRERRGGKRSRWTLRPSLHAPELQQHVPKREPERNFVMNLQTTWAEATNTMPPALPAMRIPGFAQECLGRLGAEGASVVELINGLRRVTKQRASEGPAQGAKSVSARARTCPTLGGSQTRAGGAMTSRVTTDTKAAREPGRTVTGTAKRKEEREAAIDARATLERLTPFSKRSDRIIFDLRSAANLANGTAESTQALNRVRAEAARSLNAVCRLLETAQLTQKALEQTRDAVSAWLTEIKPSARDTGPGQCSARSECQASTPDRQRPHPFLTSRHPPLPAANKMTRNMSGNELLTERETAEVRRCSTRKLQRDRAEGRGCPYVRIDGRIFYRRQDLDHFIAAHVCAAELRHSSTTPLAGSADDPRRTKARRHDLNRQRPRHNEGAGS